MRVHLVTYATSRFLHRQRLLGWSATCNRIAETVTEWNPARLIESGFDRFAPEISLQERGSGFWAWKPYIISKRLLEIPDGDAVLYCDVGRLYPFKLLEHDMTPFFEWMDARNSSIMPGVMIPWSGQVGHWTKRHALRFAGMDTEDVHRASPVQASFSIWKADTSGRDLAREWAAWCSNRDLVSDDPSVGEIPELPSFRAHRHDQALLTLLCLRNGVPALDLGAKQPNFDCRSPSDVAAHLSGRRNRWFGPSGFMLRKAADLFGVVEQSLRKFVKFGRDINE